jgi:hypothetical protein
MEKEFVSYEIALKLKELGFDEPCITYYYELTSNLRTHLGVDILNAWTYKGNKKLGFTLAPLYQQVFKWFREKHELNYKIKQTARCLYSAKVYTVDKLHVYLIEDDFYDFKSAEIAILEKMIEIVEKNAIKKKIKQTGIEFLRDFYKNDYGEPNLFDKADKIQIQIMNEFSQWIFRENYRMSHYNSFWYKENNITKPNELSELYQTFLQSRNE